MVVVAVDFRYPGAGFTSLVDASSRVHQLLRQCKWNAFRRWKVGGIDSFCKLDFLASIPSLFYIIFRIEFRDQSKAKKSIMLSNDLLVPIYADCVTWQVEKVI